MTGSESAGTIGVFDAPIINTKLQEIINEGKLEKESSAVVQQITTNVNNYCKKEIQSLTNNEINWQTKEQIINFGTKLQRISQLITNIMIISEKDSEPDTFISLSKELIANFVELYRLFIKECQKYVQGNAENDNSDLLASSEIDEYLDILQGDILPDWQHQFNENAIQAILEDDTISDEIKDFIKKYM